MKIRSAFFELLHADRQTEKTWRGKQVYLWKFLLWKRQTRFENLLWSHLPQKFNDYD